MKKYTNKGFTLIELLVVIAIIGILSSVVLASLNTARGKGKDARIQTEVVQIRTALETEYNGSNYPSLVSSTAANRFAAPIVADGNIKTEIADILLQKIPGVYGADAAGLIVANGTIVITKNATSPATGYAIYAKLNGGGVTCVDSSGGTKQSDATYPAAAPVSDALAIACQ